MDNEKNPFRNLNFNCNLFEYLHQVGEISGMDIHEVTTFYYIMNMWDKKKFYESTEFLKLTTPAPLSEQKQEGETVEQAAIIAIEKDGLFGNFTLFVDGARFGAQWQSQNTAKQIEELRKTIDFQKEELIGIAVHIDATDNSNVDLLKQVHQYKARIGELEAENKWYSVSELMPPFDKLILLKGKIVWRSENSVSYFSDMVVNDYEQLEYGYSGYFLKEHSDYLVVNHPNPEEVASEYITDWRYID